MSFAKLAAEILSPLEHAVAEFDCFCLLEFTNSNKHVNSLAQVLLCATLTFEGVSFDASPTGLFGLFGSWSYLWRSVYLGAIPGVVGMVSFTAVLKWLHPLWSLCQVFPPILPPVPSNLHVSEDFSQSRNLLESSPDLKVTSSAVQRERERFTSSPTFLCGDTPATLG